MVNIGTLAKHYGKLPSEVAAMGSTFDIMIYDVMTAWDHYQKNPGDQNNYREEDLLNIVKDLK